MNLDKAIFQGVCIDGPCKGEVIQVVGRWSEDSKLIAPEWHELQVRNDPCGASVDDVIPVKCISTRHRYRVYPIYQGGNQTRNVVLGAAGLEPHFVTETFNALQG